MRYAHFDMTMKIGVKLASNLRKMTISRVENACKPLILQGLQKNIKIISTQGLTVLIIRAILHIEQRKRDKRKVPEFRKQHFGFPKVLK